jgi:hypothetical protein
MAVAIVQEWRQQETERSTENYDAINERLAGEDPPEGLIIHTAGFFGEGFRIFDVWESEEHFRRFLDEKVMPIVEEVAGPDAPQPDLSTYELHSVIKP